MPKNNFRFFWIRLVFLGDFFLGTTCLVFATVWRQDVSFYMVFATLWHVHLSFCTVFAIFLAPQPLISLILHGICYMLVLQTNFHVGFLSGVTFSICRVSLGFHLFRVSFNLSSGFNFEFSWVSLGCHVKFYYI